MIKAILAVVFAAFLAITYNNCGGGFQSIQTDGSFSSVAQTIEVRLDVPDNILTYVGEDIDLTVMASSVGAITYQWYKDNVALSGQTSSNLRLSQVQSADSGAYHVILTTGDTTQRSGTTAVRVDPAPAAPVAPQISSEPANLNLPANVDLVLRVAATGYPTPTYQWLKTA